MEEALRTEFRLAETGTAADGPTVVTEGQLDRIERYLVDITDALAQVGLKRCSCCGKFFQSADPKALFKGREVVCYRCLSKWWPHRRGQLSTIERDSIEHKLVHWLIREHNADIVRDPAKLGEKADKISMIASCLECNGTGISDGRTCSRCYDGNIWVVTPRDDTPPSASGS